MELENCTPEISIDEIEIRQADVNRPALQLTGFFDYFESGRIQIIGHVENTYMQQKGMAGIVDYPTWYKISAIYVGVSRIAEPGT